MRARPSSEGGTCTQEILAIADKDALLVIPAHNEEESLPRVLDLVAQEWRGDVLVVDDGSTDGTWAVIDRFRSEMPRLMGVRHHANLGYGSAILTGFAAALAGPYKGVVTMDADGQHDPRDLRRLVEKLVSYDIVSGSRYHDLSPHVGKPAPHRLKANLEMARFVAKMTGYRVTDAATGFKAYRTDALRKLKITETGYAMPFQVWGQAARIGLTVGEVPVTRIYADPPGNAGSEKLYVRWLSLRCRMALLRALGRPTAGTGLLCAFWTIVVRASEIVRRARRSLDLRSARGNKV